MCFLVGLISIGKVIAKDDSPHNLWLALHMVFNLKALGTISNFWLCSLSIDSSKWSAFQVGGFSNFPFFLGHVM